MSLARLVITAVTVEGRSKTAVAAEYGLSRRWVQKLVRRFETDGEAAFEARSRRPHSSPTRLGAELEERIVTLRKALAEEGLDAGPTTISYHLGLEGVTVSDSTIWRALVRRGFVTPQPHKRPRSSIIRFAAEQPNERWQADITHVGIARNYQVEVFNQLDDHSRLLVGSDARAIFKASDVVECFCAAAEIYGTPASYLTDNAALFTGAYRGKGWVALERELLTRGVTQRHSRPYHPQTCGKVERFHQTLKAWLAHQHSARSIAELQSQLDTFRDYYNNTRPHRAIGRKPPATAFAARPKALPRSAPLPQAHNRVRHDVVGDAGKITLRYASRLHHIGIGRAHAGTPVLILAQDLNIRIITEDGEILRELTLDPARDYQPLAK